MDLVKNVQCEGETEILVEQQLPKGVLACDHVGLVINKLSGDGGGGRRSKGDGGWRQAGKDGSSTCYVNRKGGALHCTTRRLGGPLDGLPGNSFVAYLYHTIEVWGVGVDDVGLIQSTKAPKHQTRLGPEAGSVFCSVPRRARPMVFLQNNFRCPPMVGARST